MRWAIQPVLQQRTLFFMVGVFMAAWLGMNGLSMAQSGAAISQGFTTTENEVTVGALVSLERNNANQVNLANIDRINELTGVIVDKAASPTADGKHSVQVATSGVVNAVVSDLNGSVTVGDKITASPISGVGMKATQSTQVVGTAQTSFNAAQSTERTITDKNNRQHKVRIGSVALQVNVSYYVTPEDEKTLIPPFLQDLANSIAGKKVSLIRILVSTLLLLLCFSSIGILLYASIRSSIISIGRNPLSEGAVHKSLLEVGGVAIGILLVMLSSVYLILTL